MCVAEPQIAVPTRSQHRTRRPSSERPAARQAALAGRLLDPLRADEASRDLDRRAEDVAAAFEPRDGWQRFMTRQVADLSIRLERCGLLERRLRDWASYRALLFWEDDQRVDVETIALKLAQQPGKVVARLQRSPAGLDWLLLRWRSLARLDPATWTDEQRALAANLAGDPTADVSAPGFVAAQIADLTSQVEAVAEGDALLRGLVEADLSEANVPGLAGHRRHEHWLRRQMQWCLDQLGPATADPADNPAPRPTGTDPATNQIRETKPITRPATGPTLASALPQAVTGQPVAPTKLSAEPVAQVGRTDRSTRTARAADQRQADRRRVALAHATGS